MNRTVELVNEWAQFEKNYKEPPTIEEFCRHYLTSHREKKQIGQNFRGSVPPQISAYLAKLIGKISQQLGIYVEAAIQEIDGIGQPEDFYFLNAIQHFGEARKTDVITYNLTELSSGIDVINRLIKRKLAEERVDPEDKRAKLVRVTAKGEKALWKCYEGLTKASDVCFWDMSEEDKKLCIQLLKGVEIKHSSLVLEMKGKPIDEIHEAVTGVKVTRKVSMTPPW